MHPQPQNDKGAWRRLLRERLGNLPAADRTIASAALRSRILQLPEWRQAHTVLLFSPLPDEPDIRPIAASAQAAGKQVAWPAFDPLHQAYALRIASPDQLQPGHLHIPEPPVSAPPLHGNQLDFVLVPGLGFAPDGRRLGRGKGYMDRLLATVTGFKCGVAFDFQVVDHLPSEPHDVPLDCILTPSREWRAAAART